jgi:hypothetical protein
MKTIIKQRLLTALLLMGLSTGLAQAWVFTTNGIITSGYDSTGVFGTANQDLTGLAYTQTFTLDPAQFEAQYTDSYQQQGWGTLLAGTAMDTVTVNGLTHSYLFDLTQAHSGMASLSNYVSQGLRGNTHGYYDEAFQSLNGTTIDGQYISAYGYAASDQNSYNIGLSYTQIWSYSLQRYGEYSIGSHFNISSGQNPGAWFDGAPTFISINAVPEPTSNAVPEPTGLILLALGLIGLADMHRKFLLKA